jgi:hypothetical protein
MYDAAFAENRSEKSQLPDPFYANGDTSNALVYEDGTLRSRPALGIVIALVSSLLLWIPVITLVVWLL